MSSSISSFKNELKAILVVACMMGVLQVVCYVSSQYPVFEHATFRDFPKDADQLAAQTGTRAILLGNSLTQNGYDMALFNDLLKAGGVEDVHVARVALSGSSLIEWYHIYEREFARRGRSPDVVVINMSPNGASDQLPQGYRIGWLADETDWADVPEVLFKDLRSFEFGGQYLQARVSGLYQDRWDIRIAIVRMFTPDIWHGMSWVNNGPLAAGNAEKPRRGPPPPPTYSTLIRALELAKAKNSRVLLVAMPARETYAIDPRLFDILKAHNAEFLDCRTVPNLGPEHFEDGWHLNVAGGQVFTTHMAGRLPPLLKSIAAKR